MNRPSNYYIDLVFLGGGVIDPPCQCARNIPLRNGYGMLFRGNGRAVAALGITSG
jgi:hypothetical protein